MMFDAAWTCAHMINGKCDILGKECTPGEKGCVLYGKAKFADTASASNAAFDKKQQRSKKKRR